jgi:alkylated DNA repair protein (DNA oxidative demethylase)
MNAAESTIVCTLDMDTQRRLVEQVREVMRLCPLVRPRTPNGLPMRVRVTAAGDLGWVGDGEYRYSPIAADGFPWPPMPDEWREIFDRAVLLDPRHSGPLPKWDSAIVNWYEPGSSLGWHRDRAERTRKSIATISLGDAASWAVEVDGEVSRTRLESGAVTVLAGELRDAPHTVERVIPAPMFSPITDTSGAYVPGRIAITGREAG